MRETYEAAIVGAGPSGLAAALVLGRARVRTLLLDDAAPGNYPSGVLHGFVTRDGASISEFRNAAMEQLRRYPSVEIRETRADRLDGSPGQLELQLSGDTAVIARRVLLCCGIQDELPPLEGLTEAWGKAVFSCPYCHGWEVRDKSSATWRRRGTR